MYFVKEELSLLLAQHISKSLADLVFPPWETGDEVLHIRPSSNTSLTKKKNYQQPVRAIGGGGGGKDTYPAQQDFLSIIINYLSPRNLQNTCWRHIYSFNFLILFVILVKDIVKIR